MGQRELYRGLTYKRQQRIIFNLPHKKATTNYITVNCRFFLGHSLKIGEKDLKLLKKYGYFLGKVFLFFAKNKNTFLSKYHSFFQAYTSLMISTII